jgi:hypothetical protein
MISPLLFAAAGSAEERVFIISNMNIARDNETFLSDPIPQVINILLFQLVWVVTVLSADLNRPWPGPLMLGLFFFLHSMISSTATADFLLAAIAVSIGFVVDTLLIQAGLLSFEMNVPWTGIAPFWILILWANFALTLNNGFRWLKGRYKSAAIIGFFGGPLSYLVGIKLGAGSLHVAPFFAFLIIGACWAIVTPALLITANQLTLRVSKS